MSFFGGLFCQQLSLVLFLLFWFILLPVPPAKIFAIGDIHGCDGKLEALLKLLPYDRMRDQLVFLGDYINRGLASRQVIDRLLAVRQHSPQTVFLRGNHEQAILEYARSGDVEELRYLRQMGVELTLESYGRGVRSLRDLSFLPSAHREFLQELRYSFFQSPYLFVHADCGLAPLTGDGQMIPPAEAAAWLSSRRLAQEAIADPGVTVVFGHVPFASPLVKANRIGIDTGAVYGNFLTAVELPTLRFYYA